jgi:MFS superfamily sulfate permease-like transporter
MVLGNIPGRPIFHNLNQYKEALRIPSFIILAVESPIYFANATYLQERLDNNPSRLKYKQKSTCIVQFSE